jgi:hypothetical protein
MVAGIIHRNPTTPVLVAQDCWTQIWPHHQSKKTIFFFLLSFFLFSYLSQIKLKQRGPQF